MFTPSKKIFSRNAESNYRFYLHRGMFNAESIVQFHANSGRGERRKVRNPFPLPFSLFKLRGNLHRCHRHLLTGFSATATHISTSFHLSVIAHFFAVIRTPLAHLWTNSASPCVEIGATQHKVGTRLADFSAILHQPDVSGFSVHTAFLQAVGNCVQANAVAVQAVLNTLLHLLIHLI